MQQAVIFQVKTPKLFPSILPTLNRSNPCDKRGDVQNLLLLPYVQVPSTRAVTPHRAARKGAAHFLARRKRLLAKFLAPDRKYFSRWYVLIQRVDRARCSPKPVCLHSHVYAFLRFFVEETKSIRFDLKRGNLVASFSFLLFARDYIRETRQGKRRVCGLSKSAWFTWVVVVCCALATILTQLVESGATTTSAGGEKGGRLCGDKARERASVRKERGKIWASFVIAHSSLRCEFSSSPLKNFPDIRHGAVGVGFVVDKS